MRRPAGTAKGDDFFFIDGEKEPQPARHRHRGLFLRRLGIRQQDGPFYGIRYGKAAIPATGARPTASTFPTRWLSRNRCGWRSSTRARRRFPTAAVDGFIERDDLMSSVAYWYQTEPHKPWPALPAGPDRLPFHDKTLVVGLEGGGRGPTLRRPAGRTAAGRHHRRQAVVLPAEGREVAAVAGNSLPRREGVDRAIAASRLPRGGLRHVSRLARRPADRPSRSLQFLATGGRREARSRKISPGNDTLRFECGGKNAASSGVFLGVDSLWIESPAYFVQRESRYPHVAEEIGKRWPASIGETLAADSRLSLHEKQRNFSRIGCELIRRSIVGGDSCSRLAKRQEIGNRSRLLQ